MNNRPHLFLDVDGVFANFDEQFRAMFGKYPKDMERKKDVWSLIDSRHEEFWTTLPLCPGWDTMWEAFKEFKPTFLTGVPSSRRSEVILYKTNFLEANFPGTPVISCASRDKQFHMKARGDILVDDRPDNCARWSHLGGYSVEHVSPEESIKRVLRKMNS